jgi:hypothetical protein
MTKTGREFEQLVHHVYTLFEKNSRVQHDIKINGRQIDVAVYKGEELTIIECKDSVSNKGKKIGVALVDEVIGKRNDTGAKLAIIVANCGFTKPALDRAGRDKKIMLVNVVISRNPKSRTIIKVPVVVERKIVKPYLITNDPFNQYKEEKLTLQKIDQVMRSKNDKKTLLLKDDGIYELKTENNEMRFMWIYHVSTTKFYNTIPLTDALGIMDHSQEIYTTKSFEFYWKYGDLDKNWTVITKEPEKVTYFFDVIIITGAKTTTRKEK